MTPREPGKHALIFIFITVLIEVIGLGIVIPVLPKLIIELSGVTFGVAATIGGYMIFTYAFIRFFFAPIIGNLSDRFGRRPVLLLALFAFGMDYMIAGMAPTLTWLFIGRALSGMAGATYATANAYIADISPPEKRAQNFGLIGAAFGIGFTIGPAIGGLLGEISARLPFFVAAGLAFANMAYGYFVLPETLDADHRREFKLSRANPIGAWKQLKAYPIVIGLGLVAFFYQIGHDTNPAIWTYYTMEKFNWTPRDIGWSMAFLGIMVAIVQGGLTRTVIPRIGENRSIIIGLKCAAVGFVGFAFASEGWMMYAWIVPWAMMGLAMPAMRAIMSNHVPPSGQGELQGGMASIVSATAFLTPPIMARLFRYYSGELDLYFPGAPFFAAGIICVLGLAVFYVVMKRYEGTTGRPE
jgi:DHA1 family tetracycline resistance protein-like MFS transporter